MEEWVWMGIGEKVMKIGCAGAGQVVTNNNHT